MPLPRASPLVEEALDRLRSTPEVRPLLVLPAGAPPSLEEYRSHPTEPRLVRQVIERFGRHPHRNAVLGRASTPEESEYVETGEFPHNRAQREGL